MCAPPSSRCEERGVESAQAVRVGHARIVAHRRAARRSCGPSHGFRRVAILERSFDRRTAAHDVLPGGGPIARAGGGLGRGESAVQAAVATRIGCGRRFTGAVPRCGREPVSSPRRHPGRTPKEVSMRPRNVVRPAAAGALCFAFTCAGAQAALAQTDTTTSTEPTARAALEPRIAVRHRKLDVRAGKRTVVAGRVAPVVAGLTRLAAGQARAPLEGDRPRSHRCCRALRAARATSTHGQHARPRPRRAARRACCRASAGSAG